MALAFTSCATKIDPNSKKAFLSTSNRDIVWDQKIFSISMFGSPYEVDKMFLDDLETQNEIKAANQTITNGQISFWILWGASVAYISTTAPKERNSVTANGLLIAAVVSSSIFNDRAERKIRKSIDKYNEKMNYSFTPYIYEENQSRSFALGLNTLF